MQIIRHVWDIPTSARGSVAAIGNFDGLHLGHRAVIAECVRIAKAKGKPAAVLTFEPHPRRFFNPASSPLRLMTFAEKAAALRALGVDILFAARFNPALSQLSAEEFIRTILVEGMGVAHVVTGEDFIFGKGRGGSAALLKQYAAAGCFAYHTISPSPYPFSQGGEGEVMKGEKISSSRIRALLTEGRPQDAAALLGHTYAISGRVLRGDGRGRQWGFPTANILPMHRFLPKFGIYTVKAIWRGTALKGAASLGMRPMFEVRQPLLEAHFFDFHESLYGDKINVEFMHYLRPERHFTSTDELIFQMRRDCDDARAALAKDAERHAG